MKTITSLQNPEIKAVAALSEAKERKRQKRFIAEGLRTCSTLLNSQCNLVQLYATESMVESIAHLVHEDDITIVSEKVFSKMSQVTTPSGILAVFEIPQPPALDTLKQGLVLARLSDPGNVGTLIRSCAAFNIDSVVMVEGVDPWSPKVVQSSAGTIGNVTIFQLSWDQLIAQKTPLTLCALVVSGGKKPQEIDLSNALLVVGNEAEGIPDQWIQQCALKVSLPMPGNAESLNAAVAGSIALYLATNKK